MSYNDPIKPNLTANIIVACIITLIVFLSWTA